MEANIPYDQFVEELLTATGENATREGATSFNGATNFLSGKLADGGLQAAAKTAQIFLECKCNVLNAITIHLIVE